MRWHWIQNMKDGNLVLHRKNLSKFMSGKDMGIPIYFLWIGEKYSHILGNLWKLVSYIWELCGFLNSIYFYSRSTVWEYISFPHDISTVWNFILPIHIGFVISSNFLKSQQPGNDMAVPRIFPFYGNLYIPKNRELYEFSSIQNLRGSKEYGKSLFSDTFLVLCKFTLSIFWELYGFLLHPKNLRNL